MFFRRNNLKNPPGVEAESLRGFRVGEAVLLDIEMNYMNKVKIKKKNLIFKNGRTVEEEGSRGRGVEQPWRYGQSTLSTTWSFPGSVQVCRITKFTEWIQQVDFFHFM